MSETRPAQLLLIGCSGPLGSLFASHVCVAPVVGSSLAIPPALSPLVPMKLPPTRSAVPAASVAIAVTAGLVTSTPESGQLPKPGVHGWSGRCSSTGENAPFAAPVVRLSDAIHE